MDELKQLLLSLHEGNYIDLNLLMDPDGEIHLEKILPQLQDSLDIPRKIIQETQQKIKEVLE